MSLVERAGAYRLSSNVPVTVYQFNPLEYRIEEDCDFEHPDESVAGNASRTQTTHPLLPSHTFRNRYIVTARPTQTLDLTYDDGFSIFETTPGFVTVMATVDGTEIIHSGSSGGACDGTIAEMMPDETQRFTLNRGDAAVAQRLAHRSLPHHIRYQSYTRGGVKYCHLDLAYDLTGSEISQPPHRGNRDADALSSPSTAGPVILEESLFPIESWGKEVVVTIPSREGS